MRKNSGKVVLRWKPGVDKNMKDPYYPKAKDYYHNAEKEYFV